MRTSSGCWTCRLRRKKCDETLPSCAVCTALDIDCYFDRDTKPDWMDGGIKQDQMLEHFKLQIREKARYRSRKTVHKSSPILQSHLSEENENNPNEENERDTEQSSLGIKRQTVDSQSRQDLHDCITLKRSDTILFNFFLETLLPFQFPFYRPSPLNGGRAWILEMLINQPVMRQTVRCQSLCFLSAMRKPVTDYDTEWGEVLQQTADSFQKLRRAIQDINRSIIADRLHGAIRVMTGIVQLQRAELAMLRFTNWQFHLKAMLALFEGIFESVTECDDASGKYNTIIRRLSLNPASTPSEVCDYTDYLEHIPSAEQAAFSFLSALVIFDDIIASTILQGTPKFYAYHNSLLDTPSATGRPPINMKAVLGIENWVISRISEIAMLDVWKKEKESAGILETSELMHRTIAIRKSILDSLVESHNEAADSVRDKSNMLNKFTPPEIEGSLVTQIWGHAALIYLSCVCHGLHYASVDSSYGVRRILNLLERQISPVWVHVMTWPFCMAALVAESVQRDRFRVLVRHLRPPGVYGTVHNALRMVENVWSLQDKGDINLDLASCFELNGFPILLV